MQVFSAKIRLAGSLLNEVERLDLTVPEIILLRAIHGDDAVVNIQRNGTINRDDLEERDRLLAYYDSDPARKLLASLFGPNHQPLPEKIPGIDLSGLPHRAGAKPAKATGAAAAEAAKVA